MRHGMHSCAVNPVGLENRMRQRLQRVQEMLLCGREGW